jgi:4,5-DOPA dioxygenase extradiol
MHRRSIVKFLTVSSLLMIMHSFKNNFGAGLPDELFMPALFVGHGSPMNAIEDNEFSQAWKKMAQEIPRPQAILCISAHWETTGSWVTGMATPRTIHDFGGFPQALFDVQYPAPGIPALAREITEIAADTPVEEDYRWGLDHGCWSVLKQMYPKADIPTIQLSLDVRKNAVQHYDLARLLTPLRRRGILVIGSGNIVHNLGRLDWGMIRGGGFDWAIEANDTLKELILSGNISSLCHYQGLGKAVNLSIPTPEHFLPLLYVLGIKGKGENVSFFNDKAVGGSLTMTSLLIN